MMMKNVAPQIDMDLFLKNTTLFPHIRHAGFIRTRVLFEGVDYSKSLTFQRNKA